MGLKDAFKVSPWTPQNHQRFMSTGKGDRRAALRPGIEKGSPEWGTMARTHVSLSRRSRAGAHVAELRVQGSADTHSPSPAHLFLLVLPDFLNDAGRSMSPTRTQTQSPALGDGVFSAGAPGAVPAVPPINTRRSKHISPTAGPRSTQVAGALPFLRVSPPPSALSPRGRCPS